MYCVLVERGRGAHHGAAPEPREPDTGRAGRSNQISRKDAENAQIITLRKALKTPTGVNPWCPQK